MRYAAIVGTGSYLPARAETNQDLADRLATLGVETSDEWIRTRTGIEKRHLAAPEQTTSALAAEAAKVALSRAGLSADQIDLIIVATTTPDKVFPSTACLVQSQLQANHAFCFDVQAVCSGFVYGLTTAQQYIQSGMVNTALVIGAETFTRLLDWKDRSTCVLFGDGAGAVVLQASETPGILAADLGANGQLHHILEVPAHIGQGSLQGTPFMQMQGQAVFKEAVSRLSESAEKVCQKAGVQFADIDYLVPHQANIRIMQALAKKMGLPMERVVMTVQEHANTSAASVPLALHSAVSDGRLKAGQLVLMQGVGGGFTWGSVLVRL